MNNVCRPMDKYNVKNQYFLKASHSAGLFRLFEGVKAWFISQLIVKPACCGINIDLVIDYTCLKVYQINIAGGNYRGVLLRPVTFSLFISVLRKGGKQSRKLVKLFTVQVELQYRPEGGNLQSRR